MNGWDTAHELHERYGRTVPIIVVTASEHARERGKEVGADGVLAKPFDINELRDLVARFIGRTPERAAG
jgi:DNA-binding response OmpR family regulator